MRRIKGHMPSMSTGNGSNNTLRLVELLCCLLSTKSSSIKSYQGSYILLSWTHYLKEYHCMKFVHECPIIIKGVSSHRHGNKLYTVDFGGRPPKSVSNMTLSLHRNRGLKWSSKCIALPSIAYSPKLNLKMGLGLIWGSGFIFQLHNAVVFIMSI